MSEAYTRTYKVSNSKGIVLTELRKQYDNRIYTLISYDGQPTAGYTYGQKLPEVNPSIHSNTLHGRKFKRTP